MRIKKGDKVIMLSGKDRGKSGKVILVSEGKVVVEGLNMVKRHQRPRKQGQKGQIISKERAVHVSSVQLVCPKCSRPARVGYQKLEDSKIRICKKCNSEL